jgi:hypothetical protein
MNTGLSTKNLSDTRNQNFIGGYPSLRTLDAEATRPKFNQLFPGDGAAESQPQVRIMDSPNDDGARPTQSDAGSSDKCFVCAYSTVEHCFCKIGRTEGGPMPICCPDCVDQYLDASRGPLQLEEHECRAFVNRLEMFIGVDKPWSLTTATTQ